MKNKFLPIGTVVLLNGGSKEVMITGYSSIGDNDSKVYDYNGCIFPEGYMENIFCLFDNDQIDEILHLGLENDEYEEYTKKVDSIILNKKSDNGLKFTSDKKNNNQEKKHGRTPKAPTNPKSKSEMLSEYGVTHLSGMKRK